MRDKPALPEPAIAEFLRHQYRIQAAGIAFLPRGGDINAALYRVTSADGRTYFLKLLRGDFDETSVLVPRFLAEQGMREIIAPIATVENLPWTRLAGFTAILYPFVAGQNAFEAALTERQWEHFGAALGQIHAVTLPPALESRVRQETYPSQWRERALTLLARVEEDRFEDPIAAQYAGLLADKANAVRSIVQKAEGLAAKLKAQEPRFVLCHSDIHAGNLLVDAAGSLFIIDWDHPVQAPKERDLMFIGGGVGSAWYSPWEERAFYQGYGQTQVDAVALAYYRFERIVEDIAEWGEQVLYGGLGEEDRARALQGLKRWFSPHDVVAMAYRAEKADNGLGNGLNG